MMPKKNRPIPDAFNEEIFPFGKRAGDNKYNLHSCPFCTKPPTKPTAEQWNEMKFNGPIPNEGFYLFRDELSAREYYISGLCQDCQDETFKAHPGDD